MIPVSALLTDFSVDPAPASSDADQGAAFSDSLSRAIQSSAAAAPAAPPVAAAGAAPSTGTAANGPDDPDTAVQDAADAQAAVQMRTVPPPVVVLPADAGERHQITEQTPVMQSAPTAESADATRPDVAGPAVETDTKDVPLATGDHIAAILQAAYSALASMLVPVAPVPVAGGRSEQSQPPSEAPAVPMVTDAEAAGASTMSLPSDVQVLDLDVAERSVVVVDAPKDAAPTPVTTALPSAMAQAAAPNASGRPDQPALPQAAAAAVPPQARPVTSAAGKGGAGQRLSDDRRDRTDAITGATSDAKSAEPPLAPQMLSPGVAPQGAAHPARESAPGATPAQAPADPALPPPVRPDRIVLRMDGADNVRIQVDVRGDVVRTRIITSDAALSERLTSTSAELTGALAKQGFGDAKLVVGATQPAAAADIAGLTLAAGSASRDGDAAQQRFTGRERPAPQRDFQRPDQQRRRQQDAPQQHARDERER